MVTRISISARNAAVDGIAALLDASASVGSIEIRSGAQPATPATAASGTLLGTLTLSDPAFGTASNGTATANAINDDSNADASGTAGWFRAYDGNSNAVIDGSITGTGGDGDLELDDTNIVAGGVISVTSWTITMPGA